MSIEKNEYNAQAFSNTIPPPPPYSTLPTSDTPQTLAINYGNWSFSITVTDPNGRTLFSSHRTRGSTRLEVTNQNEQTIGYSKRSRISSQIDVVMYNAVTGESAFEMHNSAGILGGSPKYTSPAFSGHEVTWKNTGMSRKIIYTLIDGSGVAVARFESDPASRIGRLELTGEIIGEERLNEVMVTLLTLLVRKLTNIEASYIAAVT